MTKYLEKLSEKVNNVGHFGANAKELEKVMSDREIMNAKGGLKIIQEFTISTDDTKNI